LTGNQHSKREEIFLKGGAKQMATTVDYIEYVCGQIEGMGTNNE